MSILLVLMEPRIRAFIRRRWPEYLFERESVDDLVQRTHESAWEAMHQFRADDVRGFKAWLFAIARNRMNYVVRHYAADRRRANRVQLPEDTDTTAIRLAERLARSARSPRSLAAQREAIPLLREALLLLPAESQRIIRLHFHERLTFPQIASQLGKKVDTVRQQAHRGILILRTILEKPDARHDGDGGAPSKGGPERAT